MSQERVGHKFANSANSEHGSSRGVGYVDGRKEVVLFCSMTHKLRTKRVEVEWDKTYRGGDCFAMATGNVQEEWKVVEAEVATTGVEVGGESCDWLGG